MFLHFPLTEILKHCGKRKPGFSNWGRAAGKDGVICPLKLLFIFQIN